MLRAFDALRAKHEGMDAGEFNADGTYKDSINLVKAIHPAPPGTQPLVYLHPHRTREKGPCNSG